MHGSSSWLFAAFGLLVPLLVSANALASALQADCPTAAAFCNKALRYVGKLQLETGYTTSYKTSSTKTVTFKRKTIKTTVSTTTTISKTSTVTKTVGKQTKTVQECLAINSCGPITVTGQQGVIRIACTSLLRSLSGKQNYTVIYNQPTSSAYISTKTSTQLVDFTTTLFPVVTTTIPTKTVHHCVTVPPPAASCKNHGVESAEWDLIEKDVVGPPLQWNISYYKTILPYSKHSQDYIGGYVPFESDKRKKRKKQKRTVESVSGCNAPIYDGARGYIYAPQTGNYRFSIPGYDQAAFIWVGEVAYSGFNVSNALLKAVKPHHDTWGGPRTNFSMEAGKYYAFRSAFRCLRTYDYSYWFNIQRPDGFVMFGEFSLGGPFPELESVNSYGSLINYDMVKSDYIVRFGCGVDEEKAPKFPPYGHET